MGASVTFWEATAPVKLPACRGPAPRLGVAVRHKTKPEWYFTVASPTPERVGSLAPTYATQARPRVNDKVE